jgi:hypothetical protein
MSKSCGNADVRIFFMRSATVTVPARAPLQRIRCMVSGTWLVMGLAGLKPQGLRDLKFVGPGILIMRLLEGTSLLDASDSDALRCAGDEVGSKLTSK